MNYLPLDEDGKLLSLMELANRWYCLFPEEFRIESAVSEKQALSIIVRNIDVYLKASGTKKLIAVIKQEFVQKRGGFVLGGIDGVHRKRPLVSVNVYYFDPVEVNRFEAECFIKNSQYKKQSLLMGSLRLDRRKQKVFLGLDKKIKEIERKSTFPTAEELVEQQPEVLEISESHLLVGRHALERASQQQRIADMQEEKLELELRELKSKGALSLHGNPEAQHQWMLNYEAENNIDTSKPLPDEILQAYRSDAIKAGMSENSFKYRCRERSPKVRGIDRRTLKK